MREALIYTWLVCTFLSIPSISEESPFTYDLKTGQTFSFQQEALFFSDLTGKKMSYKLDYTKWSPEVSNGQIVLYNHGLQSHRGWFNATGERLRELGYTVYALDRIGSGTSSNAYAIDGYPLGLEDFIPFLDDISITQKRGHIHNYETHLDSIDLMLDIIESENPNKPIHLWANSYGSKIITRYLLDHHRAEKITSTVFTTPGLFRNTETMPLPFSKLDLVLGKNIDEFPSPVTPSNNDNGASWFTDLEPWYSKIKADPLSVRVMTRKLALQTRLMDSYIANNIENNTAILSVPRFYLLVDQDPMMDNDKVKDHINKIKTNSIIKNYDGGKGGKHFLAFTTDANTVIKDIHSFFNQHAQNHVVGIVK